MEKTLIVNAGSSSKKYALFGEKLIKEKYYEDTLDSALTNFLDGEDKERISKVAIRIVSPFEYFQENKIVDEEYIKKLEENLDSAPLHIAPVISEVRSIKEIVPKAKIIAISDSAFHKTIPEENYTYAVENTDIRKYGYHGISVSSLVRQIETMTNEFPKRLIVCHLGSGVSITAIKNKKSFDTSMGFTPLDGVIMNTRVGSIDPGAILYLLKKDNLLLEELEEKLNKHSGITQVARVEGGVKALLELQSPKAKLAIEMFVNQIKKYIGGYSAEMGGLDWLVFTATIGERSVPIRAQVCENLEFLGVELDDNLNKEVVEKISFINKENSKVKIAVIPTAEMKEMWELSKNI